MIFPALLLATAVSIGPITYTQAHHAISTTDSQSQAFFDRGLTLFYAYNGSEGRHVFEALQAREPKLAMAYWGEALSDGRDINTPLSEINFNAAHTAIEKAAALEKNASGSERAYIDAMRLRYGGAWSDHDEAENAYRAAMAAAFAKFPQDDDLGALYVEALLENSGVDHLWKSGTSLPFNGDTATMVSVLDTILARSPQHVMANHLTIHIFEPSTDHSRALISAARLDAMTFAPEDEHLAHMTAHTYVDVGQYGKAVTASNRAIALFDEYLETPGIDPAHRGYIWHDLQVGFGASMMLGNYAQTLRFVTRLATRPHGNANLPAFAAARFGRLTELKNVRAAGASDPTHFALAYAKLLQADASGAKAELVDALDTKTSVRYLLYALRGAAETALGNRSDAQTDFTKAQAFEKEQYAGEELPLIPTGEIMGGAYYRAGNYDLAETAYRSTLDRYPNDARALYGLSQTFAKEGKTLDAQSAAKAFSAVWAGEDTILTPASL
ncbi:MAG: hypothetical protein ABR584_04685 [Candidatus Baltobacteraceae bacterium]